MRRGSCSSTRWRQRAPYRLQSGFFPRSSSTSEGSADSGWSACTESTEHCERSSAVSAGRLPARRPHAPASLRHAHHRMRRRPADVWLPTWHGGRAAALDFAVTSPTSPIDVTMARHHLTPCAMHHRITPSTPSSRRGREAELRGPKQQQQQLLRALPWAHAHFAYRCTLRVCNRDEAHKCPLVDAPFLRYQ